MSIKANRAKQLFLELEIDGEIRRFEVLRPSAKSEAMTETRSAEIVAEMKELKNVFKNTLEMLSMFVIGYDEELFGSFDIETITEISKEVARLRGESSLVPEEKKS